MTHKAYACLRFDFTQGFHIYLIKDRQKNQTLVSAFIHSFIQLPEKSRPTPKEICCSDSSPRGKLPPDVGYELANDVVDRIWALL